MAGQRMSRLTVEPGRHIYRDGKPFVYVARAALPDSAHGAAPAEADEFTRGAVECINALRAIVGPDPGNRWGYDAAGNALNDEIRNAARAALAKVGG